MGFSRRIFILFTLRKFDFIFIHREATPVGPPVFEWVIGKILSKKIIYDFDDAIWFNDPGETSGFKRTLKWKSKIPSVIRMSYKVSCGNKYLADFASRFNKRVIINPTTIDTNYHKIEKSENPLTLGWTGTHTTLQYLDIIKKSLKLVQDKNNDLEFIVISNREPALTNLKYRYIQWNKSTEISDLLEIGIGVMPLSNDVWSKGKCGFKALQYMALGIPCVASPVGVNKSIISDGETGFLCNKKDEWVKKIEYLIRNEDVRKEMGRKGRAFVVKNYSVKSNEENFLSLFG